MKPHRRVKRNDETMKYASKGFTVTQNTGLTPNPALLEGFLCNRWDVLEPRFGDFTEADKKMLLVFCVIDSRLKRDEASAPSASQLLST